MGFSPEMRSRYLTSLASIGNEVVETFDVIPGIWAGEQARMGFIDFEVSAKVEKYGGCGCIFKRDIKLAAQVAFE